MNMFQMNMIRTQKKVISIFLIFLLISNLGLQASAIWQQIKVKPVNNYKPNLVYAENTRDIESKVMTAEPFKNRSTGIVNKLHKKNESAHQKSDAGGPTTPEVQGFTQTSGENLVNLSTGDFNYSIPLLDVGGYPIAINYNSQVQMNDESSWVGLGWSLNAGSVNRNVRGLPDDFRDVSLRKEVNIKEKETKGIGIGLDIEYAGIEAGGALDVGGSLSMEIEHDNYEGYAVNLGIGANARCGNKSFGGSIGMDIGISSNKGAKMSPSLSMSGNFQQGHAKTTLGGHIGMDFESREGLKSISYGISARTELLKKKNSEEYHENGNKLPGFRTSYSHSFASPSYNPSFEIPYSNYSSRYKVTLGGEVQYVHISGEVEINEHKQNVYNYISKKAFGYLYSQYATDEDLLDYNRANEGVYYRELPALPITSFTHDIYSVSAYGLSGSFRPMRNDIGTIHSAKHKNTSFTSEFGAEVGIGAYFHGGGNIIFENGGDVTQKWSHGNELVNAFQFVDTIVDHPQYEPVYFKSTGELTAMQDLDIFNTMGGFEPVRATLHRGDDLSTADATNLLSNGVSLENTDQTVFKGRKNRNKLMTYRTRSEIRQSGEVILADQYAHPDYNSGYSLDSPISPSIEQSDDLIEEINVINEEGLRYQFGLPAYNNFIEEISFNISAESSEDENGNVIISDNEMSINNSSGEKHFYSKTTTPSHAYAWLITGIFSPDYSDITRNGPSPDDLGTYTEFNYIKTHNNYLWKNPHQKDSAQFQEGNLYTEEDNSASVLFGGKEIYYLHQIKTRNYTAQFYSSPRRDAVGVENIYGGNKPGSQLNKLDSIRLFASYANTELVNPIKTVYFEYDYSLCNGNPSTEKQELDVTQNGKLCLKKISFSFQESMKHKESPYVFTYAVNPSYHGADNDRWGNYKPNQESSSAMSNDRFPYVTQDKELQDHNAKAWLLSEIKTPLGGKMNIEYESDDYSFVQDKKAMCMYQIIGVSNTINGTINGQLRRDHNITPYLFFNLPPTVTSNEQLFSLLEGIEELYYNVKIKVVNAEGEHPDRYQYIQGFMPLQFQRSDSLSKFGIRQYEGRSAAWIKLKIIAAQGQDVFNNNEEYPYADECITSRDRLGVCLHPFTLGAYEFICAEEPKLIKPTHVEIERTGSQAFTDLEHTFNEVFAQGLFNYLANSSRAESIDANQSFIRLNLHNGRKLGGGARVKKIEINDRWDQMQMFPAHGQKAAIYGVEYSYSDNNHSTGVSSYEPLIGKDENALVLPVKYRRVKKNAIDISNYQLEPLGEIFYPAAQVIYSKVTQRALTHPGVNQHGTGFTVHEFFTSKDFPVIAKATDKFAVGKEFMIPLQVYNRSEIAEVVTQGFYVELNNMDGQLKKISEYDEYGNLISFTENIYKTHENGSLNNLITTVNGSTGIVEEKLAGVDYECIVHADNYITFNEGGGVQLNIDVSPAGPIPFPLIVPVPVVNQFYTEFRGHTITKLITRVGILERVRKMKLGSVTESQNLAYDQATGRVIVTSSDNEFNKKYYTVDLPAHWAYPKMGHSSKNSSLVLKNIHVSSAIIFLPNIENLLSQGDEFITLKKDHPSLGIRLWVYSVDGNSVRFIRENGSSFGDPGFYDFYLLRSANRNQISASVGSFICTENPLSSGRLNLLPNEILLTSAIEYSDYWQSELAFAVTQETGDCECDAKKLNLYGVPINASKGLRYPDDLRRSHSSTIHSAHRITIFDSLHNCSIVIATKDESPFKDSIQNLVFIIPEVSKLDCASSGYLEARMKTNSGYQYIVLTTDCWELIECHSKPGRVNVDCGGTTGIQNPFLRGIFGNFRPITSYSYLTKRNTGRIDQSGFLENYLPYWEFSRNGLSKSGNLSNWQRVDSVIVFNSRGATQEVWNALNIPSSSQYHFGKSLVCAQALNASYTDIAFDGFEDYTFNTDRYGPNCEIISHFTLDIGHARGDLIIRDYITDEFSHTGNYSCKILPGIERNYNYSCKSNSRRPDRNARTSGTEFISHPADLILPFAPTAGTHFFISTLVNANSSILSTYRDAATMIINGVNFRPDGPIIDGWQQIKGNFTLSPSAIDIHISLSATSTAAVYFDDIKIEPDASVMENYIYTSDYFRLQAKLDDLNYASFYEYDAEGKLERSKRETEVGIYTIQESRSELPKGLNNR
ncbi:MAG: hypothetical protein IPM92_08940 [Saprospiraceae bacterium]|nr:hypothetical protein [Saprospiraceae bacterium]